MKTLTEAAQVREALRKQGFARGAVKPASYHAWKSQLGEPCVSKSTLIDFMRNPFKFRWEQEHGGKEETAAMRKGSLIDCLVLTPELFENLYAVEEINRRTKEGKAREAELLEQGKTILTPKELAEAQNIEDAAVRALTRFAPYGTQEAMWVRLTHVGSYELPQPVIVSGMLDVRPGAAELPLLDLKTTSADLTSENELNRAMANFGYGIQAAMYVDLWQTCTGEAREFAFLFVSTDTPAQTRIVRVGEGTLELYRRRYREAIARFSECAENGVWGAQELPEIEYRPPMWEINREGGEA
ncbi:MAG: PD-(D/E)XK nuclease-like domain-containing protein [Akkermansiaceae bacterium]|nr:PD-(D/E)XK nuclease-like domain-containing protein [Akkermansiaceae bacterium]